MADKTLDLFEYPTTALAETAYGVSAATEVRLLLHADGSGSTFTDSSYYAHTVTANGNSTQSDTQKKFGAKSIYLDGTGDYLSISNETNFVFSNSNFTIDMWCYLTSSSKTDIGLFANTTTMDVSGGSICLYVKGGGNKSNSSYMTAYLGYSDNAHWYQLDATAGISTNTWTHIALVRNGSSLKIYKDGTDVSGTLYLDSSTPQSDIGTTTAYHHHDNGFTVGSDNFISNSFTGYIDEVRVCIGSAKWTTGFTPETSAYTSGCISVYSEPTIKRSGAYSMKIIANTASLNQNITKTLSPAVDLTGVNYAWFWTYASRTGSNFKVGIQDSGSTTSEYTVNTITANTWQLGIIDLSSVTTANKDAINKVIITILNADSDNTIYIDSLYGGDPNDKLPIHFKYSGTDITSFQEYGITETIPTAYIGQVTSGLISQGLHTIWIPAAAMYARTTNGAASGTAEMSTNKNMFKTLDFDTTTAEYAQFAIQMPKSWDEGTITAAFVWSHAATTTNFGVAFGLQGVAISNDDAGDVAFGTAQLAVDTGGTTNDVYVSPTTSAITIAGTPAANDYVMFQVYRAVSDNGDTMGIDARLHGVQIYYTIDAGTDS